MEASFPEFTINAHPLVLGGFAAYDHDLTKNQLASLYQER